MKPQLRLNADHLKLVAIIAMTIDHIAKCIVSSKKLLQPKGRDYNENL